MKPRKPKRTAKTSLIDKLSSGGTETFTGEELGRLLAAFEDQAQENLQCRRAMHGIAEALKRHNLQVTHTDNPDGSVSFVLQPAPPDDEPTVAEQVMN